MLKHVVFFKFKKNTLESDITDLMDGLKKLPALVPEIKEFVYGKDVVRSERSYDFALVSSFEDLECMGRYQVHPAHQEVVGKVKQISESMLAVDFEY